MKIRLLIFFLASFAVASLIITRGLAQTCPSGQPPCYSDAAPIPGHGPASSLPAEFNCNCPGDNRRVVTIRIDASWNVDTNGNATPGQTNANVWNAVQCAKNQWNTVKDPTGFTTGYYFVVDQANHADPSSTRADITITRATPPAGGFASAGVGTAAPYTISLSPSNGNLNGGAFTATDLCGRVAHEIGHEIGIGNATTSCNTIMSGANADGTRTRNQVTPNDVFRVNRHFDPATQVNCTASRAAGQEPINEGGGDPGGGDPCGGDPCCGDPCCYDSCCGDPCCGDPYCGQQCYTVCTTYCYTACTAYDEYGDCYWWEEVCETSCETQCY